MTLESSQNAPFLGSCRLLLLVALLAGLILRIYPSGGFHGLGFDENLYRGYVIALDAKGIAGYPEICRNYLVEQRVPENIFKLPPTRFLYIFTSWAWKRFEFSQAPPLPKSDPNFLTNDPALVSLHRTACAFSCFLLILCSTAAGRMFDRNMQIGVTALISFSPLLLQMAQHALVDGFFAFFAVLCLWLLWENLLHPNKIQWLCALAVALALMVTVKENSFFVYVALCGLMIINRWGHFGTVTLKLWLVCLTAPAAGLVILISVAGGFSSFLTIYQILIVKNSSLQYAILTGDGPWYRYLVDLLLISPLVLCLAIGGLFTQVRKSGSLLYLVCFVFCSYLIMCNIPYAMNLRYATIWELPLRSLAVAQILWMANAFGKRGKLFVIVSVAALCFYDLNQYVVFFVDGKLYELVTSGLLEAVKILK